VSNPRRRTISFNGQNLISYKPLPGPSPHRINNDVPGSTQGTNGNLGNDLRIHWGKKKKEKA